MDHAADQTRLTPPRTPHAAGLGVVDSVNVGQVRTIRWRDRLVTTGIWKEPVTGPVAAAGGRHLRREPHRPRAAGHRRDHRRALAAGSVLLEVSGPRLPCYKLGIR